MRALVTGAGGFIGGHVVRTLVAAGAEVRALYRNPASVIDLPREVDFVRGDIRDFDSMRRAVEGCDTVYHSPADLAVRYKRTKLDAEQVALRRHGTAARWSSSTRRCRSGEAIAAPRRRGRWWSMSFTAAPARTSPGARSTSSRSKTSRSDI